MSLVCKSCEYKNSFNETVNCVYCGEKLPYSRFSICEIAKKYEIMTQPSINLEFDEILVSDYEGFRKELNRMGIPNHLIGRSSLFVNKIDL